LNFLKSINFSLAGKISQIDHQLAFGFCIRLQSSI